MSDDIRASIDRGPMTPAQWSFVAICVTLNMLDGYDVLVMAFTAPQVSAQWGLKGAQLGVLLSAGLFGMSGGSLFLAPWADRFGRRALLLFCLALISGGMALSAITTTMMQLAALRVVTGLGIGGMLASLAVITSEYSNDRWRSFAVSLQATGYPIGATIGGAIAGMLIARHGWRSAFLFGAACSLAMIPVVYFRLPEALDFLLARRPAHALDRLNALLSRMRRPVLTRLPATPAGSLAPPGNPVAALFAAGLAGRTVLIWSSFFLVMFSFYFVLSWTPKLLVAAGLSNRQGVTGGVLLNLGGIAGGLMFGYLAAAAGARRLTAVYLLAAAVMLTLFGMFATTLDAAFLLAILIGAVIFGSMVGLYTLAPQLYPASIRTTGMGWAIGIGRIGAILSPMTAGLLIDAGWQTPQLYYAFAVPLVAAMLTVRGIRPAG